MVFDCAAPPLLHSSTWLADGVTTYVLIIVLYKAESSAYNWLMRTLGYSEAKNKLSEALDDVERTHDEIVITRHGRPTAVLMSPDALESLRETVFWLSKTDVGDAIRTAEAEYAARTTTGGADLRAEYGLPDDGHR